jgi:hypothetical protein
MPFVFDAWPTVPLKAQSSSNFTTPLSSNHFSPLNLSLNGRVRWISCGKVRETTLTRRIAILRRGKSSPILPGNRTGIVGEKVRIKAIGRKDVSKIRSLVSETIEMEEAERVDTGQSHPEEVDAVAVRDGEAEVMGMTGKQKTLSRATTNLSAFDLLANSTQPSTQDPHVHARGSSLTKRSCPNLLPKHKHREQQETY